MKPNRRYFRHTPVFGTALRYGTPAWIGFTVLVSGLTGKAAIFGGAPSGTAGATRAATPAAAAVPASATASRDNARALLNRTNQAVGAARALQQAARAAAIANSSNNLGLNPSRPSQSLPAVPNGLAVGGLHAIGGNAKPSQWTGATAPTQTVTGGITEVTIKQTTQQALLSWQTFNVGKNTSVTFDQSAGGKDAGQWIAFNKVSDPSGNPGQILGSIKADGQVYVINPNGIIFGGSSQVNARGLTVSSLPVNDGLIARGLLNNPDRQFLFSALAIPGGENGTPAFTPDDPLTADGRPGDVVVQAGAEIHTPVSADGNGGRIMLVGPNVSNAGHLSSPAGQVILAAGLQVGASAHLGSDPGLRGLDVFVGAVADPASPVPPYAGGVIQNGLVDIARGSAWLTGRSIYQNGVIDSSTSVGLNGRIDLTANYDAVPNLAATADDDPPFIFKSTGHITLGVDSVTRILPELTSSATTVGTELALRSKLNLQGKTIHLAPGATILAPNALAAMTAGNWIYNASLLTSSFVSSGGQVYLDAGSVINLAGTTAAAASVLDNLLTLELRGSELAPAPLQREGVLRGASITVNLAESGTLDGRDWIGTPLADLTGYAGLIQRNVGQLTTTGGTLEISAGGSVVLQAGSVLDVSGGWTEFQGGVVQTSSVTSGGRIVNIADALPDQVYQGLFTGTATFANAKWGVSETFSHALNPAGARYQEGYTQGADAGAIRITAPAMALDGMLLGTSVAGAGQLRSSQSSGALPQPGTLALSFRAQDPVTTGYPVTFPAALQIIFSGGTPGNPVPDFATDADGNPAELDPDRRLTVQLAPELVSTRGFANLTLRNEGGGIVLPDGMDLNVPAAGALSFTAGNIDILGSITAPGGSLEFRALNLSPYEVALRSPDDPLPLPVAGRGRFTLGPNGKLSTAGLLTDDRAGAAADHLTPLALHGGTIAISAFSADLRAGGVIDVSGGFVMPASGRGVYGAAGTLSIKAGQDLTLPPVLGGMLALGSSLAGFSGATAGSLVIQAPTVQIGDSTSRSDTLLLQPGFFDQGGFGDFTLTGLGVFGDPSVPAVRVAAGTRIEPAVKSFQVTIQPNGTGSLSLDIIQKPVGERTAASLRLAAPGVSDTGGLIVRGDVVVEEGAVIQTDPGASVSVSGNTIAILGSIMAPGGTIRVSGSSNSGAVFGNLNQALVTTYLGSNSILSTAGTTVLRFDPYGRQIGSVLGGGDLTVSGNLVAAAGATLDVSGVSGWLDVSPTGLNDSAAGALPAISGLAQPVASLFTVRTQVDSNGGHLTLKGGQMLFTDATMLGSAGGPSASGGSLEISSGRFYELGASPLPTDVSLVVSAQGPAIGTVLPDDRSAIGRAVQGTGAAPVSGLGRFAVERFTNGSFDALSLGGVLLLDGPVSVVARRSLEVATGGILYATADVRLAAPLVVLGRPFAAPLPDEAKTSPFQLNGLPFGVPPTHGSGSLLVNASQIDAGDLSLQGIGTASLTASQGDIRGNGTLAIAGNLELRAGQIYPSTASDFSLLAYNYDDRGLQSGSISIEASGTRGLPLSAGGNLSVYASIIHQSGVLRAPFGTITLGWDGTGAIPTNLLTGNTIPCPVTKDLHLASGSITSVSAVDPLTGTGLTIPYGVSPDGNSWIDPRGVDITASGPPEKSVVLSGGSITTDAGSTIDLRGGGDLYAYRWVKGLGGPADILASVGSFAIMPGYDSFTAMESPFNSSTAPTNLIAAYGPGYVNDTLKAGDRIYLNQSDSLPAGFYTLLPARYALLPGAFLVSPSSDKGAGTIELADQSSLVSGYRYNGLNSTLGQPALSTRFDVASSSVVRKRAEYQDFLANVFLRDQAAALNIPTPALPKDSANLLFQGSQALNLQGSVSSLSIAKGAGSAISISTVRDILIAGQGADSLTGVITLNAGILNSFGAESLLIGGSRSKNADGTSVTVRSGNITVDNAGTPLAAADLLLVAGDSLSIKSGAALIAAGTASRPAESVSLVGNGTLVRVSTDAAATSIRQGVTGSGSRIEVDSAARISGGSIILDSSSDMVLAPDADFSATAYSLNSGRIRIRFDQAVLPGSDSGLVLEGGVLKDLGKASALSLLSYSSIDIYGSGRIGGPSLSSLTLNAGSIGGFNQPAGVAGFDAKVIVLGNAAAASNITSPGLSSGSLEFHADTIQLGLNRLEIHDYENVRLVASGHLTGSAVGALQASGNLTVDTPWITGASTSNHSLSAGGVLNLTAPSGSTAVPDTGESGATFGFSGSSVNVDTRIRLSGGSLSLLATQGDLTVNGSLDVSGTVQRFYDVSKFTDAGDIRLIADAGNVILTAGSTVNVSALPGGGDAGTLRVTTPNGTLSLNGSLSGFGGAGGSNGNFELDTRSLPAISSISSYLTSAGLTQSQSIRVRTGDVLVDGLSRTDDFLLSADHGSISVTGTIDASGITGGSIQLVANGDVVLNHGSILTAAGREFSAAGQGGTITLEAGSQRNGVVGTGKVSIKAGAMVNLALAAWVAGDALTPGSSASMGQFGGKLHLRAPRVAGASGLLVDSIDGNVIGASSLLVEGYRLYDLTASGGTITSTVKASILSDSKAFLGAAGTTTAAYTAMVNRLLSNNPGLGFQLVLAPGVEIINRTGDITLGSAAASVANDWDLSEFRFGEKSAAGVLTLRAAGNLNFFSALSDGFTPTLAANNATRLWLARPTAYNPLLPANSQSWSYRLTAGADLTAVDFGQPQTSAALAENAGFLKLATTARTSPPPPVPMPRPLRRSPIPRTRQPMAIR